MNNLIPDELPNPGNEEVLWEDTQEDEVFVFPASFGQQRLWFLDQFEPGSPYYNIPMAVRLRGSLNVPVLNRVINEIIRRHESLRTTFATIDNKPVQIIHPKMQLPVLFTDFSNFTKEQQEIESKRMLSNEARHSFNLQAGPLIRIHLVRLSREEHLALLNMHHIVSDGWSMGIFIQELIILYDAFLKGQLSPLPELTLQYADYADWQREWLQGDVLDGQLTYWKNQLDGILPVLELPVDRPRPSVQTNAGANTVVDYPRQKLDQIIAFSRHEGATLFMTLLATFQVLLARLCGQEDISVGTPVANRSRGEVEQIIGLFINTLVIRTKVDLSLSFRNILKKVKENALEAFSHQDIPFEMLVDAVQPERDMSHSPLFQVMFILQNAQQKEVISTASDLTLEQIDVDSGTSTFDITVSATEQPGNLNISIEYNTDLFDHSTIDRFLEHFVVLLDSIIVNPDFPVASLPVMSDQEKSKILVEWNNTRVVFPEIGLTIPQLFEAQVLQTPDQIAVVSPSFESRPRQSITYSLLNQKANLLARALRDMGVKPESIVGICLDKSIETVIAILGILKAGGAYLPLDPQYPIERLSFMIADSDIQILITKNEILNKLPENNARLVFLDESWEHSLSVADIDPEVNPQLVNSPDDLVYLIYTSGSTGQAKGVMLEHKNLVNAFLGWEKDYQLSEVHSHLQMANFSFDVFSGDFVRALCSGGKLVLCPRNFLLAPDELFNLIKNEQIDIAEFVPAVLRLLIQYLDKTGQKFTSMKRLICGSDSWYAEEYKTFLKFGSDQTKLINSFGLTEATIDSTFYEGSVRNLSADQVVPIGKPFPNTRLYILDKNLQPVPIGVKGELFIGGSGVARGYLNRPELTQEKFIPDPFASLDPEIELPSSLYRTGDATRYLPDGNVEFLGRMDFQVKIRGFRVETGEIEAVLRQFPGIQDAVVVAARVPGAAAVDLSNQQRLVGYVVAGSQINQTPWAMECQVSLLEDRAADSIKSWHLLRITSLSYELLFIENIPEGWQPGQSLTILLPLPGRDLPTKLNGRITWINGNEGCLLIDTDEETKGLFRKAILTIAGERIDLKNPEFLNGIFFTAQGSCILNLSEEQSISCSLEGIALDGIKINLGQVEDLTSLPDPVMPLKIKIKQVVNQDWDLCLDGIVAYKFLNQLTIKFVPPRESLIFVQYIEDQIKNHDFSIPSLKLFLKSRLPDYMVPAFFVTMDSLPLTPNGKIDRQALPVPDWSIREVEQEFVLPRNEIEEQLAKIWSEILGLEKIGVFDNFFELGGHSLLATQVISRIRSQFKIDMPLRNIFESPTISSLSEHIVNYQLDQQRIQAPPVIRISRDGRQLPLSFAQQRLWFLDQLEPNSSFYNLPESVRLRGSINIPLLEQSLNEIVRRHESLRTIFTVTDGQPQQWILPELPIQIPVVDLTHLPSSKREAEALRLAEEEVQKPFNLATGPLLRATILRLAEDEHIALFTMHHIIGDAWSSQVLIQELTVIYSAFLLKVPSPLQDLSLQYADFAYWQRDWLKGEVLEEQINYWKRRLAGLPPLLELATDKPRPPVQTFNGTFTSFLISENLSDRIKKLSHQQGVTLFMLLLAAFQAMLYRYTNQEQIGVGTPIANRNRGEIENLIGFFVNTLVLNADFSSDLTFVEFLKQVKGTTLGAYAHQDLPFEMIVDALQPERNLSHSPLFQVMFTLQNGSARFDNVVVNQADALSVSPLEVHSGTSKFDLTLFMLDEGERISGVLEYNTDLFYPDTIDRMVGHFRMILEGITANPDSKIWMLPLMTPAEKEHVLYRWNDTAISIPGNLLAHHLFEEQVDLTPDSIAVSQLLISNRKISSKIDLSFQDLNQKANKLANYLVHLGIGPDKLVGLCLERSIGLVVAILGVLKSGGAYIPLDPTYPSERLDYMLGDSQASVLITQENILQRLGHGDPKNSSSPIVICIDRDWPVIDSQKSSNVLTDLDQDNLAYIIYTSGSTGKPKGAMIQHKGLVNYLLWCKKAYPIMEGQGSPVHSSISFDLTVTSLFTPLISGHCVTLLPEDLGVEALEILLDQENDFSLVKITPAHLQMLGEQIAPENANHRTRAFIIGGENLLFDHVAFWRKNSPETQLVNEYGPTETVVGCCVYWVPEDQVPSGIIPIGKPITNTRLYVLDKHQQPVPIGIPGELYIGGMGVGRGYLNRPELTAERFMVDPFVDQTGARMYRSGDLVRYLPDGNLTCLGRIDFQVKIRGFRVELGEIEAVLGSHPGVKDTCVWVNQNETGKRLVAYVVPLAPSQELQPMSLRAFLRQELPEYMVPTAFVFLSEMPLTPNGKIDRRALPAPEVSQFKTTEGNSPLKTPEEEIIASVWSQVLGTKTIGAADNFFELGGHSLLATQVMSRLGKAFNFDIPLKDLFEYPTVELLAQHLTNERLTLEGMMPPPITSVSRDQALPLSFAQQRLWFLDQLSPGTPYYNIPVAVRLTGDLDIPALEDSLNQLIQRHESLRTTFRINEQAATDEQQVVQVIAPQESVSLLMVDLSDLAPDERQRRSDRILQEDTLRPFDLANGPLMRCSLVKLAENEHIFIVNSHHIITDDWSLGILVQELAVLYGAITLGDDGLSLLPEMSVQYADYAVWQRSWLKGSILEGQFAYWQKQLSDLPPLLDFPIDFPRPAVQSFHGSRLVKSLSQELSKSIRDLSQTQGTTLFMTLLSGFEYLLHRYSGQDIFGIGTPIANRTRTEQDGLIGFFVNTLVIKADFSDIGDFKELLSKVRRTALDAYAHQDLPFEMLVDRLQPERDLSHTPFFQVMFVLQNAPKKTIDLDTNLILEPIDFPDGIARFDLTVTAIDEADQISLAFDFNVDLFKSQTIDKFSAHLIRILSILTENPDVKLDSINYLVPKEVQTILVDWNRTEQIVPDNLCAHEIFEQAVALYPDVEAVIYAGSERKIMSYRELDEQANQLAHYLQETGVGPGSVIGVCMRRSVELIIGILGILKAGGAYLPLDPNYPVDRLAYMIQDSNPMVILTMESLADLLPFSQTQIFCMDKELGKVSSLPTTRPDQKVRTKDLAYIIYTSGSTGKPKGVLLLHQGLVNLIVTQNGFYQIHKNQTMLQFAALSFDASVWEIFLTISHGATLVMAPQEILSSGLELLNLLRREKINLVTLPPSLLSVLSPEDLPDLHTIIAAGEPCTKDIVDRWAPGRRFVDAYGPTETTVCASLTQCFAGDPLPPSIGKPIGNYKVYIVDQYNQPVPVGVPGELWIGGVALARGYLNRVELTNEKFIANPFDSNAGSRVYRTGDRVRWREDGNLEFLGRIDDQVKIRGFRMELGEIESCLLKHPQIQQVAVVAQDDPKLGKRLVAFYLPQSGTSFDSRDLQDLLRKELPEYMVPSILIPLERFPLSPAGKIDKKALQNERVQLTDQLALTRTFDPPVSPEEQGLAGIFADLLGLEQVGRHENFFELGGHSLLATRVITRIKVEFQVELPLRILFERPTVAEIASYIQVEKSAIENQFFQESIPLLPRVTGAREILRAPLSFAQQRLWFLDQFDPGLSNYNLPIVVKISGDIEIQRFHASLNILAQRHEILRTIFMTTDQGLGEQVVLSRAEIPFDVVKLSDVVDPFDPDKLIDVIRSEIQQPFSLGEAPAIRVKLFLGSQGENYLIINMHHIISDGWSLGIFIRELVEIYIKCEKTTQIKIDGLSPLPVQYADFASWQRSWLSGEKLNEEINYWVDQLSDLPPSLNLPTDFKRPPIQTFNGQTLPFEVPVDIAFSVKKFCREEGITLFMGLLAVYQVLLSRYSGQTTFGVGTPIANRTRPEVEAIIGFFVNTLVMKADLKSTSTFRELVHQVKNTALEAYIHQDVPFEMLVDRIQPHREMSHSPLFQVVFSMQNNQVASMDINLEDIQINAFDADTGVSKFDLTLSVGENVDRFSGAFEFNTDLFSTDTITRMQGHFLQLIKQAFSSPELPIGSLVMITEKERLMILNEWNQTYYPIHDHAVVTELFTRNADLRPYSTAVAFGNGTMTYAELDAKSTSLAQFLINTGISSENVVGVCLERNADVIVSLLGIMKAGGVYLPLDPGYPSSRLGFMLDDIAQWQSGKYPILITYSYLLDRLPASGGQVICLDRDWDDISQVTQNASGLQFDASLDISNRLAYIIYTSGSTGKPKGVAIQHMGLRNMVQSNIRDFGLSYEDCVLQFASLSFDASINEIFLALISGAKLVMAPREILSSPVDLVGLLEREKVTFSILPPSLLKVLSPDQMKNVKTLVSAGESCSLELGQEWSLDRKFYNAYGPTEATIGPTLYHVSGLPDGIKSIPIGKPIDNMQVYILDQSHQLVPVGIPGEIYIGGIGLARYYINLPDLTDERFIINPFDPSTRLYKTGDLGKWLPDGNVEYLGRVDFQVKIRGFRIELEEIERILNQHPLIKESVILAREDLPGSKRLVAYIVPNSPDEPDETRQTIRKYLRDNLPEYMVPASFVLLDHFPLTVNGKIDRKALPVPEYNQRSGQSDYIPPVTKDEIALTEIWKSLLGLEQVSINDNFFDLGGDSIVSIQLVARAGLENIQITPRQIFQHPTIAGLAAVAGQEVVISEQGLVTGEIPLTPIQRRFFAHHQISPDHWNTSMMLAVFQEIDPEILRETIRILLEHHDALRMQFTHNEKGWNQIDRDIAIEDPVKIIDLTHVDEETISVEVEKIADQAQRSLDLQNGPLMQVVWMQLPEGIPSRLLMIFHHSVFDGVSWRIFIEDFQSVYTQLVQGQAPKLLPKTTSYKEWANRLYEYAQTDEFSQSLSIWSQHLVDYPLLPVDFKDGSNRYGDSRNLIYTLSLEETGLLIKDAPGFFHVQVNEIMISLLVHTLSEWIGSHSILVELYGQGRESIFYGVDISRTIGWFTTAYPAFLDIAGATSIADEIKLVSEQLRRIPNHGISYGMLRYLNQNPQVQSIITQIPSPQINFNYLGQFDQSSTVSTDEALLPVFPAPESRGLEQNPQNDREAQLFVVASVSGGEMTIAWSYSTRLHREETVQQLANRYLEEIRKLVNSIR